MALKPVTVSQLNDYISRILSTDPLLGAVVVKGELSGVKYHSSGHIYFSIVDEMSKISCFYNRDYLNKLPCKLEDGMQVILTGGVSVFKKNGTYSLYVRSVEIEGEGDLAAAFEKLKQKLQAEGLFDATHKKPIPSFPHKIGIVTSRTGAAVADIMKILRSRNDYVDVVIFPCLVQGDAAAGDIAEKIQIANTRFNDIDVLIVGRGGGSADDLWAFNEEVVARAIYQSEIPVISAVGHEIDFTISDFVADLRAETPTAAAQLAVPDLKEVRNRLSDARENLNIQLGNKIMYNKLLAIRHKDIMKNCLFSKITEYKAELERKKTVLEENNPLKIMETGYAVISDENHKVISTADRLKTGNIYTITMKDGHAECVITGKEGENNE